MLRERARLNRLLQFAADAGVVAAAFLLVIYLRHLEVVPALIRDLLGWELMGVQQKKILWLGLAAAAIWLPLLWWRGHLVGRGKGPGPVAWRVLKLSGLAFMLLATFDFLSNLEVNRSLVVPFAALAAALLLAEKLALRTLLQALRRRGRNTRFAVVVGLTDHARRLAERLGEHSEVGCRIKGYLLPAGQVLEQEPGVNVLGSVTDLRDLLHRSVVDDVFFALPLDRRHDEDLRHCFVTCQELGINFRVIPDFFELSDQLDAQVHTDEFLGIPLLSFSPVKHHPVKFYLKSVLDFLFSLLALAAAALPLAAIAVLIKLTSRGPVFFRQLRAGLNGREFFLFKFRTMVDGAESMRDSLQDRNIMAGPVFKVPDDPRVTRIGRFLRRWSLDELPQLFNVIKGEMSLVGPRPLYVREARQIKGAQRRRLSMKPGITCFWQISGRNEINFEEWMRLDLEYIDHWSLLLDLKILAKTLPALLLRRGAY